MSKYNKTQVKKMVKKFEKRGGWNHLYHFPCGTTTIKNPIHSPGFNTNKWSRLSPIIDTLSPQGKTLLDVGCSDGYFSIMSAQKDMLWVRGIDPDPDRIERANFAKDVYNLENVFFETYDLYDLNKSEPYDIVLGLGLIHRVPDIDSCLDTLSAIGRNVVLEFKTFNSEEDICRYHGGKTKSNKWNGLHYTPSKKYVIARMQNRGLSSYKIFEDSESRLNYKRTIILFTK